MEFVFHLNVVWGTFIFLLALQMLWTIWTTVCIWRVLSIAEVPFLFTYFAIFCAVLSCVTYIAKAIAYSSVKLQLQKIVLSALIVNVIFHIILSFIIIGWADSQFGLHFYYDLPLVSTTLAALDMAIFPHFLIFECEDMERKRK